MVACGRARRVTGVGKKRRRNYRDLDLNAILDRPLFDNLIDRGLLTPMTPRFSCRLFRVMTSLLSERD